MNVAVVSHFLMSPPEKTEVFWCPEGFENLHTPRLKTCFPRECIQLSLLVDAASQNKGKEEEEKILLLVTQQHEGKRRADAISETTQPPFPASKQALQQLCLGVLRSCTRSTCVPCMWDEGSSSGVPGLYCTLMGQLCSWQPQCCLRTMGTQPEELHKPTILKPHQILCNLKPWTAFKQRQHHPSSHTQQREWGKF